MIANTEHRVLKYQPLLYLLSVLFLAAPLWLPDVHRVYPITAQLTRDALVWLGLSLLSGLIAERILSDGTVAHLETCFSVIQSRFNLFAVAFLALLLLGLYAVNQLILHGFMNSADEHSCYFLAECIRHGRLWATPPPVSDFFEVVHIGNKTGKWFSVYPPGWPLLWAIGLKLNLKDWINPILAVIGVVFWFKAGKKVFGLGAAAFGIIVMCVTPFFLFNNASYFSHTTCFLMIGIFLYAYILWRKSKNIFWALVCSIALGYGLGTRYVTMAAVAIPFLLFEFGSILWRQTKWTKSHSAFSIIFFVLIFFQLLYNYEITGKIFEAPNHFYHSWERLGFHSDYTFWIALQYALSRIFYLGEWFPPLFIVLYVCSLFHKSRSDPLHTLFRFGLLYLVIAYLFYYSWGGNQYGPRYYFEALPFLTFSVAEWAKVQWQERGNIQKFIIGVFLMAIVGNVYSIQKYAIYYHQVSSERKALFDLAEKTIKEPAIVLIHGFLGDKLVMAEDDAIRNQPSLNAKILYAHDLKEKNGSLKKYYPNRLYYLGFYDRTAKEPRLELIEL